MPGTEPDGLEGLLSDPALDPTFPQLSGQMGRRGIIFPYIQFSAVAGWLISGNGLCRFSDMKPHLDAPADGRGFSPVRRNDLLPASASGGSSSFPAQIHNGRRAAS